MTWQPIETAPRLEWVIGNIPIRGVLPVIQRGYPKFWEDANGLPCIPTHWMPLPAPPQESTLPEPPTEDE